MKLSLLFINDVHGYLEPHAELFYEASKEVTRIAGGYGRLAGKIDNIKKTNEHVLVFDGGDTFHGTLPPVESKGEAMIPVLKKMGFSAMVGHWDFAFSPLHLKGLDKRLGYPVLAINIYDEDGNLYFEPYTFLQVADSKIAVIGICCNIIDSMPGHFSDGIKVTNGDEELPRMVKEVKEQGADLVILLSHNGLPQDAALLKKVDGIDVCLSAHTHNRLYREMVINKTILIQCGCHGSFLGQLDLIIEENKISGHSYELHTIDESVKADDDVEELAANAMASYRHLQHDIVGETRTILHRYNTLNSTMDELLLRAAAHAANTKIAFANGWRYGSPISVGNITRWDLFNIVPMNPPVSTVELTGKEIIHMLEKNLHHTFAGEPFQQRGGYVKRCSGLTIKMRVENPNGHRIQQIMVGTEPLQEDETYTVAFVTAQGVPEKLGKNRKDLSIKAVDAMANFLKEHSPFVCREQPVFELV